MQQNVLKAVGMVWMVCALWGAGGLWTGAGAGQTQSVATSAGLLQALDQIDTSAGVTTLRLQPGTYENIEIKGLKGPVHLVAADPNAPPRITWLQVSGSSDIHFEGLIFDFAFDPKTMNAWTSPFQFQNSKRLTFEDLRIEGDMMRDTGTDGDGYPTGKGLVFVKVQDVAIRDSDIGSFFVGLNLRQSRDVILRNTHLHGMRKDMIMMTQVQGITIENNQFTAFNRSFDFDDHPDMIQMTSRNAKMASSDITVRHNLFNTGHGPWSQTIFMRNQIVDKGQAGPEMYYRNILIEDNVIINAHLNGIFVGEADGVVIRNNTLIRNPASEQPGMSDTLASPGIRVANASRNVVIANNAAYRIPKRTGQTWRVQDNMVIQGHQPEAPGYYGQVFKDALTGDPRVLSSFGYREGGPLSGTGIGAPMLSAQP